jgi:hypothetical protein
MNWHVIKWVSYALILGILAWWLAPQVRHMDHQNKCAAAAVRSGVITDYGSNQITYKDKAGKLHTCQVSEAQFLLLCPPHSPCNPATQSPQDSSLVIKPRIKTITLKSVSVAQVKAPAFIPTPSGSPGPAPCGFEINYREGKTPVMTINLKPGCVDVSLPKYRQDVLRQLKAMQNN